MHIRRDARIGGEEPDIGVGQGGVGIVIAAAHVGVTMDSPVGGAAHDQGKLGVRLQAHESRDHVNTVPLQTSGPGDVACLVESRFELDDDGDILAGERGPSQCVCDRRRSPRPIQRQLDRLHTRVFRRLDDEPLEAARERIVRVMDEHVALVELLGHAAL